MKQATDKPSGAIMKETEGRWWTRIPVWAPRQRWSRRDDGAVVPASGVSARVASEKATAVDLQTKIGTAAFAFRGYDLNNLGRTPELLAHPAYGATVRAVLEQASALCAAAIHEPVDLVAAVRDQVPSSLATFPQDVAMIVAVEIAQLRLLEEFFGVPIRSARLGFGYSIGELTAMHYAGVFAMEQLLPVPLGLARDCAELAENTSLGVLFTRGPELPPEDVQRLCVAVSSEGKGMVGPSAFLSPNTALLLGQYETLNRVEQVMRDFLPEKVMLRRNPNKWPPLHTPIVWQRNIPNRTAVAVYQIEGGHEKPNPPILSCVTGAASYDGVNSRELLIQWTDHPQRLWDVIYETLAAGVERVVHVGPGPNLVPATFARLGTNVANQLKARHLHGLGRSVIQSMSKHAWLAHVLPSKTALWRAPFLEHIILEDWLLEQKVA